MAADARSSVRNLDRSWGRNAVRLAILAAARRIVACDGTQAATLARAADEAGFARATVYGHFRNREELLVSVIADDMATLGKMMRDGVWDARCETSDVVDPEPLMADAEPANDSPAIAEETQPEIPSREVEPIAADETPPAPLPEEEAVDVPREPAPVLADEAPVAAEAEPEPAAEPAAEPVPVEPEEVHAPEPAVFAPRVSVRRADVRAVLAAQEAAQVQPETIEPAAASQSEALAEATPRSEPEIPRVDAWLERRLRVFEHTLADIEARLEKAERGSERAQGIVADGMRDLQSSADAADQRHRESIREGMDEITKRTDAMDQRLRGSIVELRSRLNDAFVRAEVSDAAPVMPEPEAVFIPTPAAAPAEPRPATEPSQSFLSAARRAANAAAELAQAEETAAGSKGVMRWAGSDEDRRKLRTRYLISGVGVLALALIATGMLLHHGPAEAKPVRRIAAGAPAKPKTHVAATDRLTVLANAGDAKAELLTGLKYLNGGADQTDAAYWLQRAADAHEPMAQYYLGTLYEHGTGVAKDAAKAMHWFEAAAGQGNRKAMQRLGVAYAEGQGVTKDFAASARWFEKAANAGLADAQFNLAVLYERGQGVPQSLLDAYKWYSIAAAQGDSQSRLRADALATQLSPDDMAAAGRAVHAFTPGAYDEAANETPVVSTVADSRK